MPCALALAPERAAAVAIRCDVLTETAAALLHAARTLVPRPGVPFALRNVSAEGERAAAGVLRDVAAGGAPQPSPLDALVTDVLAQHPEAAAALMTAGVARAGEHVEVAGGTWRARWSIFRLLTGLDGGELALDTRIPQVQATLRVLEGDTSFDRGLEHPRYLDAAKWLSKRGPAQKGYKAVVFGHTHHAKALAIPGTQARYFNTGTWANLMRFPKVFTDPTATAAEVKAELFAFAKQLEKNELDDYLEFTPTYVRLDLGAEGALLHAELRDYDWKQDRL